MGGDGVLCSPPPPQVGGVAGLGLALLYFFQEKLVRPQRTARRCLWHRVRASGPLAKQDAWQFEVAMMPLFLLLPRGALAAVRAQDPWATVGDMEVPRRVRDGV